MQPHKEQMHAAYLPTEKKKDEQSAQALFYEHSLTFCTGQTSCVPLPAVSVTVALVISVVSQIIN